LVLEINRLSKWLRTLYKANKIINCIMNLLAHAYLSFNDADILLGNMISDYVKGKKQFDYPATIQAGIKLHRVIDAYTDTHAATYELKKIFAPTYRLYAGAFVDVVYDYFLANDLSQFSTKNDLQSFTVETYSLLAKNETHFPEKFARQFPHMREHDWLYHYHSDEGMRKSFGGLARRAKYITETDTAMQLFLNNKEKIQIAYDDFFPSLKKMVVDTIAQF
jgi:acyl carrier protein phosphodiesterase